MSLQVKSQALDSWLAFHDKWKDCQECRLRNNRRVVVQARGYLPANFMLVAESPGVSEDTLGWPLIGPSKAPVEEMLRRAQIKSYLIANILGCAPYSGREKEDVEGMQYEVGRCRPRLVQLIHICKPKAVILFGKFALKHFPDLHGIPVLHLYHPAYILRQAGRGFRYNKAFREDMDKLHDFIADNNLEVHCG